MSAEKREVYLSEEALGALEDIAESAHQLTLAPNDKDRRERIATAAYVGIITQGPPHASRTFESDWRAHAVTAVAAADALIAELDK